MLSKLAVLFTVVAYANAECGIGGTQIGSACVCDTDYRCGDYVTGTGTYLGCAAQSNCACGSLNNPCTSFTTFPQSMFSGVVLDSPGKYYCVYVGPDTWDGSTACNVPERTDSPATYNTACATPCQVWTCKKTTSISTGNCGSGTCWNDSDQIMCEIKLDLIITYIIVVIVVVVICCCIVPIRVCFFMAARRKNAPQQPGYQQPPQQHPPPQQPGDQQPPQQQPPLATAPPPYYKITTNQPNNQVTMTEDPPDTPANRTKTYLDVVTPTAATSDNTVDNTM